MEISRKASRAAYGREFDKRIATTREVRIELGENKGDKYGDRRDTRRIRGPKAPRENNSNQERNEESTVKTKSRNPLLSGPNAGDLERSTVVERG